MRNRTVPIAIGLAVLLAFTAWCDKAPLQLAIVWHQHQPLYWNRLTSEYELPWVRVHAVQEYIDSPRISSEFPGIHVTFNLQPSLLWQIEDYATITAEEAARGGLYAHIGAVDHHLEWTWALANDPALLAAEDRAAAQEQFFWLNGYMFDNDADDPYYDPYYAFLNAKADQEGLTDQELLDAAGLFLLWQTSPELHAAYGLLGLRDHRGYTKADIVTLIDAQMAILQDVVSAYAAIALLGNELITSPFYHPIVPLLVENGGSRDVLGQIEAGQAQHERLLGERAVGIWSPEQAVSEAAVRLLGEAGLAWTSTDEGLLAQALNHTPSLEELTTPYVRDGITVLFRETDLSNKVSFAYGNKPTSVAVADFLGEIRTVWEELEDPSGHLLTLAADGENWMFLAGYPNNGRSFLRALYGALAEADWVNTVTPAEILPSLSAIPLEALPTGSWAGDLATWSGEADEDEAWDRLAAARQVVADAGDPADALEAIYAAEGSDWFWWYGTDQDSGTDDIFDWLFKAHLTGAYRAAGSEDIPPSLGLRLVPPLAESLGEVSPTVDGTLADDEGWQEAVVVTGDGPLQEMRIGYKETSLYALVETASDPQELIGTEDLYLTLYASGASGTSANVATRHSETTLGFAPATAIQVRFEKIKADGTGVVSAYAADGGGGWSFVSDISTLRFRTVVIGDVIEFTLPFAEIGMEPGKGTTMALVLEAGGELVDELTDQPLLARVPTLIQGVELLVIDDPVGDDHGDGSYVYPESDVFAADGLFDLQTYRIYDADDRWQLAFDFVALTNPWGGPQGFSHPILYLYFDVAEGGSTEAFEEGAAANVAFSPEHPWDTFVRVAGWPAYGRHLWTADGQGPTLVEVASDPKRGRIIVTIPKDVMPTIEGWHYVVVGSQDGYGENYLRPIATEAGEWVGGGIPDPFWAPQIYDYLAPEGISQESLFATFDPEEEAYAELIPVQISITTP